MVQRPPPVSASTSSLRPAAAPPRSVLSTRAAFLRRWGARLRRTPFNPYWLEHRHLRAGMARLAPHAGGLLLDVGVGERPYAALFAPHVRRYVGLEYPPVVFGNLNPDLADSLHLVRGVIDVWGDGQCLPVRDACVDTVLSLEVLEHLPDPERCVADMARVLRPDGRLLLTVPFLAPLHQLPYDFRRFTPAGLTTLLERHGLQVEHLWPRGNAATVAGTTVAQYLLRHWAVGRRKHDGSISMSRWRGPLTMPFIALAQLAAALAERFTRDEMLSLGYAVVARKASPARHTSGSAPGFVSGGT